MLSQRVTSQATIHLTRQDSPGQSGARTMTQHTSRLCKGYLTKESDGVLHQMTWPPQSPDLNPTEMVWDELDCRVKENQPISICGKSFKTVGKAFQVKLFERMSRERNAVIKEKGGYFEESKIYFDLFNTFRVTT
uniref:Tc1-like transposase DDE domain-containing protein n=1 Tax=Oncorhynchus tshawytscha TaxID=74940 RepID=A0AAZ3S3H0_ONCTS